MMLCRKTISAIFFWGKYFVRYVLDWSEAHWLKKKNLHINGQKDILRDIAHILFLKKALHLAD